MTSADAQLRYLVRLLHLEKLLPPLPTVDAKLSAAFLGISGAELTDLRRQLADELVEAARALLHDHSIVRALDALPLSAGQTVVGLGDSLTADLQSWFEVLRTAYDLYKPAHGVRFVNAGVSGDCTAQMLARMPFVSAFSPTLVICLAGSNDVRRFGAPDAPQQVSSGETRRNLYLMRSAARDSRWLWLAPPSGLPDRMDASPFWASMQTHWSAESLMAVSEEVVRMHDPVLDLRRVLGSPPAPDMVLDDGLHLTLAGHAKVAAAVVKQLAC